MLVSLKDMLKHPIVSVDRRGMPHEFDLFLILSLIVDIDEFRFVDLGMHMKDER